ncbi:STAS domain-containing protein [Streptomyces sp. NPDC020898]|uniref:STAS domain-containing protein n=1 Tax=Streptomyces sp. NPDC020898 TaxID=3365101 RepID=UPI0037A5BA4D
MHFFRLHHRRQARPRSPQAHEVVRLRGDLDARNAEATGRRLVWLIDAGPDVLEIDLAGVNRLSPDGCAALLMALRAARARGTRLVITHANDRAKAILRQIGITRALATGANNGT